MVTIVDEKELKFFADRSFLVENVIAGKLLRTSAVHASDELVGKVVRAKNVLYLLYFSGRIILLEQIPSRSLTVEKVRGSMVKFKGFRAFVPWEEEYFVIPVSQRIKRSNLRIVRFRKPV